jgi:hypothetical protein
MPKEPKKIVVAKVMATVRIDPELKEEILAEARRKEWTLSYLYTKLLTLGWKAYRRQQRNGTTP